MFEGLDENRYDLLHLPTSDTVLHNKTVEVLTSFLARYNFYSSLDTRGVRRWRLMSSGQPDVAAHQVCEFEIVEARDAKE